MAPDVPAALRQLARLFADLILDRHCIGCQSAPTTLCARCWSILVEPPPQLICLSARGPRPPATAAPEHPDHPVHRPTTVAAAGPYSGLLRRVILAHKENAERSLTAPLGILLARAICAIVAADVPILLIPVPPHRQSLRRRGEDTVKAIAVSAAQSLCQVGIPAHAVSALRRVPGTEQQAWATGDQRRTRQQNTMYVPDGYFSSGHFSSGYVSSRMSPRPIASSQVLIVDDVLTTGATGLEALRALTGGPLPPAHEIRLTVLAAVTAHGD